MTLMWEVRAAPGKFAELLGYVLTQVDDSAQVYRGLDGDGDQTERLVVIDPSGRGLSGVPEEFVSRPPQSWAFEPVRQ